MGLAGLFGNIRRHAVSEKRVTQRILSFTAPLHMQGEAPPHAAYAVMLGSSPIIAPKVWLYDVGP